MSIRFRIRTPAGQELSFASRATFEDFVRSGDLSPDDLVYDAEDGSWAPARTHPIVLDIEYEQEEGGAAGKPAGSARPADRGPEGDRDGRSGEEGTSEADPDDAASSTDAFGDHPETPVDLGLELAIPDAPTPEEASRAFVERLEAERRAELDFDPSSGVSGFSMDHSGTIADLAAAPDDAWPRPPGSAGPPGRRASGTPEPSGRPEPSRGAEPPRRPEPSRRAERARSAPAAGKVASGRRAEPAPAKAPPKESGGGAGRLLVAAIVVAIAAGGGYVALRGGETEARLEPPPESPVAPIEVTPTPEPGPRQPVIARTVSAVRERALERFLTSTQAALRDLQPIPDYWPGGPYLALPSRHPEIVGIWQSYLNTVRRVRAGDADRYRTAYEAALDDAVVEGEERDQRLADGLAAFRFSAAARAAHYDRVEALATAAIQSHAALLEGEGLLLYDGPGEPPAGRPLGAGVTARDEASGLLLDNVVTLLGAVLDADGAGPGSGQNVRAWVWEGFLGAVTN